MLVDNPPAEVGGGVWMLGTAAYPMYLVRGRDEGMIVEGGISALGPLLRRQLEGLGIGTAFVRQAVITHAHPDHVMAVPMLREMFPNVSVIGSTAAGATLGMEKAVGFFKQIDAALTESLVKSGKLADAPPPPALPDNRIALDRTVREGDTITLEDMAWNVLETPGHSDCSISLYEPTRQVLIISDASGYYMPAPGTWWPNYFSDYATYLRSLERLAALPAEVLCLSHNGVVCGAGAVRHYMAGAIAATRDYHERILAETKAGKPSRQLAEELGAEIHRQVPLLPVDFFQKNCGILVKQSLKAAEAK